MTQRNVRRTVTTLALAGLFTLLPLAQLQAAPRKAAPAPRTQSVWQVVGQQASLLWGGVGRLWEKVGARIDDNGYFLRLSNSTLQDGESTQSVPTPGTPSNPAP